MKSGIEAKGKMYVCVCVLILSGKRLNYELGRQVHACIIKGRWSNLIVESGILYF